MKRMSHIAGSRRGGMTLMEVLVAVAVLSIIVVGFGQVLTQARRTVGIAQVKMKQLQHVRAIRECFTKDLQRVSKNGFLRINSVGSDHKIVMVAAGESIGRVANTSSKLAQGNAAAIVYGRGGDDLLLRKAFVMDKTTSPTCDDQIEMDFSELQKMDEGDMNTKANGILNRLTTDIPSFPPKNVGDMEKLWPVIAPKVTGLEIRAGKRTLDSGDGKGAISWDVGDWRRELISEEFSEGNSHLWTRHNQNDWPDLIKITITITDERLAKLMDSDSSSNNVTYEIICPIR